MAIEHFDEGVYASNLWFGDEMGYEYPALHLYAPPFLPSMIEWTLIFAMWLGFKPAGFIPILPCLLAGIATIPSVWWIGKKWFGPSAGLTAAWLVATSDFHASYSRAALTDVPVSFFILWAVYFIWHALRGRRMIHSRANESASDESTSISPGLNWQNIMLAAVFTGFAWWTKYNGWLPLAIGLAGGVLWLIILPASTRQIPSVLIRWCLVAGLSWLIWAPVISGLQDRGGYASVAANHRQYLVGTNGWTKSCLSQAWHVGVYENWLGFITETCGGKSANDMAVFVMPVIYQVIAGLAILWGLWFYKSVSQRFAVCLLAAWYGGLTVSTPFYHPYPRLVFPWLFAIWLGLGLGQELWKQRSLSKGLAAPAKLPWAPSRLEWCLVVLLALNAAGRSASGTAHAWQDRSSLENVSDKITKIIREQAHTQGPVIDALIVYVWGEPGMVYGLRANGAANVMPVTSLSFVGDRQPVPVYCVFGKQAHDSPVFPEQKRIIDRCQLIEAFPIHPSHLVVMDERNPADFDQSENSTSKIWLYRIQ